MDLFFGSDDGTVANHMEKELMQDLKIVDKQSTQLKPLTKDENMNVEKLFVYQQLLLLQFEKPEVKVPYDKMVMQHSAKTLPVTCIDGTIQVPIYKLDYLDMFKLTYMSKLPKFASVLDIKEGNIIDEQDDIFKVFKMNISIGKDLFLQLLHPLSSLRKNLSDASTAEQIKKVYMDLQDIPNIIVTITLLGLPKIYKYIFYKITFR